MSKRLKHAHGDVPAPRSEHVAYVEQHLVREAGRMKRRHRLLRRMTPVLGVACSIALALWVVSLQERPAREQPTASTAVQQPSKVVQDLPGKPETGIVQQPIPSANTAERTSKPGKTVTVAPSIAAQPAHSPGVAKNPAGPSTVETSISAKEQKARNYLQAKLGDEYSGYKLNRSMTAEDAGQFVFYPTINGIPYVNKLIFVAFDEAGEPRNVNVYHQGAVGNGQAFPDPRGIVSTDAAKQAAAQTLQLVYVERSGGKGEPALLYRPDFSGYVDAKSGQVLADERSLAQEKPRIVSVASKGEKLYARTAEEAGSLLEEAFGISLPSQSVDASKIVSVANSEKEYKWSLPDGEAMLVTALESGQVTGFEWKPKRGQNTAATSRLTREEALKTGVRFLQKYLNPAIGELQLNSAEESSTGIRFTFARVYQGIPVLDHTYTVTVDPVFAKVTGMSGDFLQQPVALPDSSKAIPLEQAQAEYVQQFPFELEYTGWKMQGKQTEELRLVYSTIGSKGSYSGIDALTGAVVNK